MTESTKVGDLKFASRSTFRSYFSIEKAVTKHLDLGRDLTDLSDEARKTLIKTPFFTTWDKIDMLSIYEGERLPDKPGIYGFFNLRKNVEPKHRILYIGKSLKSLKHRVIKQHNQFVKSLRFGATHACYLSTSSKNSSTNNFISYTETYLIQEWGPYLNIQENPFNFQFESLEFDEHQLRRELD